MSFWAVPLTLFSYLFGRYLLVVLVSVLVLVSFIGFIDIIELMRRAGNKAPELSALAIIGISLLNLPTLLDKILPFGVLFGSMICFYFWGRSHEFLVARTIGQNIWQALLPVLSAVFCIGLVHVAILNPIAASAAKQYDFYLESIFGAAEMNEFSVLTNGIWIRDSGGINNLIINGRGLDVDENRITEPIIYQLSETGKMNWRMQAKSMTLSEKGWQIYQAVRINNQGVRIQLGDMMMQTNMNPSDLIESKLPPKTVSIYRLPKFIAVQQKAGVPVHQYRVFFHQTLSTPIKLVGLAMLAACFTITIYSRQTKLRLVLTGIGAGFGIYFLSDILYLLGNAAQLPHLIAGWGPALMICLMSGFFLARADE